MAATHSRRICRGTAAILLCCLVSLLTPANPQEAPGKDLAGPPRPPAAIFQPDRIRVFLVGILEFSDPESYEGFTAVDRKDSQLERIFREAGVPADRITFLKDRAATLENIRKALRRTLARSRPGETFFFYYAGHGDSDEEGTSFFIPFDARDSLADNLTSSEIIATIEREFKGDRVLLTADCCRAGGLVKGIRGKLGRISWAAFCAAGANEWSTGNWTFTSAILASLQGRPEVDLDRDGTIELGEVKAQVARDMQMLEGQMSDADWAGPGLASDTVLTRVSGPYLPGRIGQPIEARHHHAWRRAKIVEEQPGRVRVRWVEIGRDRDLEERWLPESQTRAIRFKVFPVGSKVLVDWRDAWYPAVILQEKGGIHLVHYDGYDSSWDEWVPSARIRKGKRRR